MRRLLILVVLLSGSAAPALADFCMLTQNGLHLGQGKEAYKEAKRSGFKAVFRDYDVVALQEVMTPGEPALLTPEGFTATVSAAKGAGTYREHYALLTRDSAITVLGDAEYPDDARAFARPPFGVAVEDRHQGRYWLVNIHVVFGKGGLAPRRNEVAAMAAVTEWYAARVLKDGTTVERVVVSGDWNLPTTDEAFAALSAAAPGMHAAPNVQSSLNAQGGYASAYDHFVWNRARMTVDFAAEPRDTGGRDPVDYRATLSDHVGVAGYVLAAPGAARPEGVSCPPARAGGGPLS